MTPPSLGMTSPVAFVAAPAVWRYNLKYHLMRTHPGVSVGRYKHLWELDCSEVDSMRTVWQKTKDQPNKKKTAKKVRPTLKISTAHSSSLALVTGPTDMDLDEEDSPNLSDHGIDTDAIMSDPTPAVTNAAGSDAAPSLDPAQPAT
ncbi:hypothetical protein B0H10DRAFT_1968691, partial [Mycena sp. CBHHK59/15]